MTKHPCARLADYLDGVLKPADRCDFERRLDQCEACRQAVDFERLLVSAETASISPSQVPTRVAVHVKATIRRWQTRRRVCWTSGVAAAVLMASILYAVQRPNRRPGLATTTHRQTLVQPNRPAVPPAKIVESSSNARARGTSERQIKVRLPPTARQRQLALPLPTASSRVTLVMLFPTTQADRGGQSDDRVIEQAADK